MIESSLAGREIGRLILRPARRGALPAAIVAPGLLYVLLGVVLLGSAGMQVARFGERIATCTGVLGRERLPRRPGRSTGPRVGAQWHWPDLRGESIVHSDR